jgi:hypothetical protein
MLAELDSEFTNYIKKIRDDLDKLLRARQPYFGDWYEFTEILEYVSATEVAVQNTDVDLTKVFVIGDPIRWMQTGDVDYRYGYVTLVETNRMRIRAGEDYEVDNADITDVARGLRLNASGFPVRFTIPDSAIVVTSGTITLSVNPDHTLLDFYMVANTVFLNAVVAFATQSTTTVPLLQLPTNSGEFLNKRTPNWNDSSSSGVWGMAIENQDAPSAGIDSLIIYRNAAAAPYDNTVGNTNFSLAYSYKVGDV